MALAAIGFYLLQRSVSPPANIDGKAPTHRVFAATQRAARSAPALQKRAARSASALQKCAARSTPPSQERAVRSAAVFQARPIHALFPLSPSASVGFLFSCFDTRDPPCAMTARSSTFKKMLSLPKQDEVLDVLRQLRAVANAHKMYPPGHQMLRRINTRLYEEVQRLCQKMPFLALLFSAEGTELNGELLNRPTPERQFGREFSAHFQTIGINTLVIPPEVHRNELGDFFEITLRDNPDVDGALDVDGLTLRFPSLPINRQILRRGSANKVRDKMSLRELMASMDRESLLKELGLQPDQISPNYTRTV